MKDRLFENKIFLKIFTWIPMLLRVTLCNAGYRAVTAAMKGAIMGRTPRALDVAHFFLRKGQEDGREISNKKLQKLVYYAQAWVSVFSGDKLFNDPIEAWVHGPAVRSLYGQFKEFGFGPIHPDIIPSEAFDFGSNQETLDRIWRVYGKYDSNYLEILTHNEEPWIKTRNGLEIYENSSNEIPLAIMQSYYAEKLESAEKPSE